MNRVNQASLKWVNGFVLLVATTAQACSNAVTAPSGAVLNPQGNNERPNAIATSSAAVTSTDTAPNDASAVPVSTVPSAAANGPRVTPPLHDVDLLQVTPARVAVSSAVRNPHDFPEYLVDRHLDTAWNSKTGDLVGGWIAFRVPEDATIHRIEMTAGYTRVKGSTDLFAANHRITRVEVFRNGQSLGTFPLDPQVRRLQPIPISGKGADYQMVVRSTVPGTNHAWRELVVSELRVIGDPGKELRDPREPLGVAIGNLDFSPSNDFGLPVRDFDPDPKAYPSLSDLCKSFVDNARANAKETLERFEGIGIDHLGQPSCEILKTTISLPKNELYRHLNALRIFDGLVRSTMLVVEVARGYVPLPVYWDQEDPTDPGCPSFFRAIGIQTPRVENGFLIITLNSRQQDLAFESENGKTRFYESHGAVWCKEGEKTLLCHDYIPSMTSSLNEFAVAKDGTLRIQGEGL